MYTRILLKLSGEQLSGKYEGGIDTALCAWLATEIKKVVDAGTQVVVMVGGGNYARGAQLAGHGIGRVTADNIGMLATMMNALALADVFNAHDVAARVVTNIKAEQVADPFTHRRAISHLKKQRVVIVGGGIGRPYLTTDTAAVSLALELECEAVLKATKVDGIYDKDPAKHDNAQRFDKLDFKQAVADEAIKVMDKAAMGLAMEHQLPIVVFSAFDENNILQVAAGEPVGTTIS
ncbi:MAG TPA: UMP kinase [Candidatus Limnocylindrales bacterium]|nr:UMP kinase [Candidatus Limnocylindrales bacterium]